MFVTWMLALRRSAGVVLGGGLGEMMAGSWVECPTFLSAGLSE